MLVDFATNNEFHSFMDGFSGYNKILIAIEDIPKNAFTCPGSIGTFEWLVKPFDLKNCSATYQRVMNAIFHDMFVREVLQKQSSLALIISYIPL